MSKEAQCKVPRSRVVKVTDHYPSSNKKYVPSCTVLHQCADDTGCCGSPTLKCGPKSTQPILLHFLVYVSEFLFEILSLKRLRLRYIYNFIGSNLWLFCGSNSLKFIHILKYQHLYWC